MPTLKTSDNPKTHRSGESEKSEHIAQSETDGAENSGIQKTINLGRLKTIRRNSDNTETPDDSRLKKTDVNFFETKVGEGEKPVLKTIAETHDNRSAKQKSNLNENKKSTTVSVAQNKPKLKTAVNPKGVPALKTQLISDLKRGIKSAVSSQNDSGAQTLGAAIKAGETAVSTFKLSQKATPIVLRTIKTTANAVGKTAETSGKIVRKGFSTAVNLSKNGAKIIPPALKRLKFRTKKIVKGIPRRIVRAKIHAVKNIRGAVRAVRGVLTQKRSFAKISKNALIFIGRTAAKNTVKAVKNVPKAIGSAYKITSLTATSLGSAALGSRDVGVQAIGVGLNTAAYTPKIVKSTVKMGLRTAKIGVRTVKTSVKVTRGVYRAGKMLKTAGLKNTVSHYSANARHGLVKLVKNAARKLLDLSKGAVMKFAVPLVIIIAVVAGISSVVAASIAGVASIFGGTISLKNNGGEYEEFDTDTYLRGLVTAKRVEFAAQTADGASAKLAANGGEYHFVRLLSNEGDLWSEMKTGENSYNFRNAVLANLTPVDDYVQIISPVFTAKILADYGLEPNLEQADSTFSEIWDKIAKIQTRELPIEYCQEVHTCGQIHALDDCPNTVSGSHNPPPKVCDKCCWSRRHTTDNGDGTYSSWTEYGCSGYTDCGGHRIIAMYIDSDGLERLLNDYFYTPIEELSNKPVRTPNEENRLLEMRSNLEICLELINEIDGNRTDGSGNVNLSGIDFAAGTRSGNASIVNLAEQQAGNIGGRKFWSEFGYSSRINWDAAFVSWCARNDGVSESVIPTFTVCQTGVNWFSQRGQFYAGNYCEPAAGDLIFFDRNGDGTVDHIGIVVGNDGEKVYTVEGNCGDTCRIRSYPLSSSLIRGYALPNY